MECLPCLLENKNAYWINAIDSLLEHSNVAMSPMKVCQHFLASESDPIFNGCD